SYYVLLRLNRRLQTESTAPDAEYFVRGQGYIKSKEDVENTVIKSFTNGIPILIKNVAKVQFGGDIRRGALEKRWRRDRLLAA
ncbi:MAG: hypothetical protein MZV64_64700, partial [Ignavibacteriales bacterium]|nr:hypothetical protein [Ignavibacteriales bacterium]